MQDLFDQGSPPAVEVLADHGAWGAESVDLGSGLVDEVDWEDSPFGGAAFRGRPGFTYSGETLDRVVFVRAGVLPADQDTLVVSLSRLDGFASVEEMLRADPLDSLDRVKVGFKSNVYASLRHRGDDYPAYLAVVAGLGLAEGMIPAGMVLGIWDVKGVSGRQDGEAQDFYAWESPLVRVLRASLVGTVIPPVPGAVWRLPDSGEDARDSSG
ncbi:hypothetical protein [Kocuria sp.]|uniref:hypothetical protein n=1 Tax=Kocuria sp. TaxID=1871328 RepID=UPI0026E02CFF|nr:hypothetical protein [Kocuria sp.]MDO5619651.1 hypothetical protein [Kocuria sp.]